MPESQAEQGVLDAGAAAHEKFVQECREIDLAYAKGKLTEWLERKLADERNRAGFEPVEPVSV